MARDTELDRLKLAQDQAFERKQVAYQLQQSAWEKRDAARAAMNRAYDAKQHAWDAQNEAWQYLQRVRDRNGLRIDSLNLLQETAFRNMQSAFGDASSAHERRDGASARAYADQGHAYKAESQGYVAERRNLVAEIRAAKDKHEALRPAFQQAKSDFDACKQAFNTAKAEHERAQAVFRQAKTESDAASAAFKTRLEKVRTERRLQKETYRRLAEMAGVPPQYLDNLWTRPSPDGGLNFYFGGLGKPDGLGHGHYATNRNGDVTYRREPFDPHGSHNFSADPRWQRYDSGLGENLTYRGKNALKESGVDTQTGRLTINIYYGGAGGHPLGAGHGHDVFYQDDPNRLVYHRPPKPG